MRITSRKRRSTEKGQNVMNKIYEAINLVMRLEDVRGERIRSRKLQNQDLSQNLQNKHLCQSPQNKHLC